MALTPDFRISAVTADGVTTVLTDYTVYGSPNALRNTLAVAMTAFKVDENQLESSQVVTLYDPKVVTAFNIANTIDGWVKYYVTIVPYYSSGTTYNKYDLVFNSATSLYYQFIFGTPTAGIPVSNITYWTPISDPTVIIRNYGLSTQSNNLVFQIVNVIQRYNAEQCYADIATKVAKDACLEDCTPKNTLLNSFVRVDALLNASVIDEIQQKYVAGERAMRLAERYCDDCGCGCNSN